MGKKSKTPAPTCALCNFEMAEKVCVKQEGKGGKGCPTLTKNRVLEAANQEYDLPDIRNFARNASIQEAECYANRDQRPYIMQPTKTRIVEICEFAKKMEYQRLGLAFCVGLAKEARLVTEILESHGFDVVSVLCKAGRTSKSMIDLEASEMIFQGADEAMCNPVYQAKLLNHEKTEFNIMLGLCVGHDSLFFKYAGAPTTVLAVKDRVTGHNPLAAIYLSESYYRKTRHPEIVSAK
jgi:uncharacterized metal-binding protein